LDCFPFITWATEAVITGAKKTKRTATTTFFYCPAGITARRWNAIIAGAVVTQRATTSFWNRPYRLLRVSNSTKKCSRGKEQQKRELAHKKKARGVKSLYL